MRDKRAKLKEKSIVSATARSCCSLFHGQIFGKNSKVVYTIFFLQLSLALYVQ